jgi:hydrogenase expression/formation protein HypC
MCLAVPGKLLSAEGDDPLFRSGRVSFGGTVKTVNLACVPEAKPGDHVLVHAGMALGVVDEAEAAKVLGLLSELDVLAGGAVGGESLEASSDAAR